MSVSLLEILNKAEYDLTTKEDCIWLLSKQSEFAELIEQAEQKLEEIEENEDNE